MDQLRQQVARARRQLILEQWLARLVACLFAGLTAAAVAIALPRVLVIETLPAQWDLWCLVVGASAGLTISILWTIFRPRSELDAAIEIDRRFALRERVASSLSLSEADLDSEAGRALAADAVRAVKRIDVGERFHIRLARRAWLPLAPAALALLMITLVDVRSASSSVDPALAAQDRQRVEQSIEALRRKMAELQKQAEENKIAEADGLFKQIERGTRDLTERDEVTRTKAVAELNDLAKQLEQRRQQLGANKGLQKQLNNMKNLSSGPGDKLAQSMQRGDWQKAVSELEKLRQQLAKGTMNEQQRQQLISQLEQMKEKLEAAAEAHRKAMEDLKQQIEEQSRQGNVAKAGELQQKLDQLQQQMPQMNQMQQMAQQMGNLQQGLQQGNDGQVSDALSQMSQQLDQLQQEMNEMEMLDAAMDQLEMAKSSMGCSTCQGMGCSTCQGGYSMNMGMDGSGYGMGQGEGRGPRPDEENATNLRDTRVRQQLGRGSAVFGGMVEGPNVKGDVAEAIKEEAESFSAQPADPLTAERLPRNRREHAEQYFNILREGEQ